MAKKLSSNLFKVSIAPENGADATTYWLVPSTTQVKRKADGTHLPEYVSCECFSKTGNGNPVSGSGTIKFVLTYKTGSNSAEFVYGARIIVTSDMAAISFRLYVGGTKVDEKTVAVVEDGADGLPGPAGMRGRMPFPSGAFDLLTTYTATDAITPIVYYEDGKTYYVMNKSVSIIGVNPAEDYASNGSDSTWIPFENYKAIFTEILMANWAKLASAVFYGDYMFSQHGVDSNGNDTMAYEGFGTNAFTPNTLVDWLTGTITTKKLVADGAELTNVKGLTGAFKKLVANDTQGREAGSITFGQEASGPENASLNIKFNKTWFDGDLYHQGYNYEESRSHRFYTSDLWCRGQFGHYRMTDLSFNSASTSDFFAHIYNYGTDTTYHKYAESGQPIDCIILNGTGNYVLYVCDSSQFKMLTIINASGYPKRIMVTFQESAVFTLEPYRFKIFITAEINTSKINPNRANNLRMMQ